MTLPLTLRPEGRPVLVVGGGTVATRRARTLLSAGATVSVVSPDVSATLLELIHRGDIEWRQRRYRRSDLDGMWLVQTATGTGADDDVAADAEAARVWCLNGGDPAGASAWMPAVASADDVHIAVSGGGDAGRAAHLRDAVAAALQSGALPLRHRTRQGEGFVALVGGGPGHPDLITSRGRRLLAEADVVVIDRLAPWPVLDELSEVVEVVDVGKLPDHHPVPQDEINRILVARALEGKVVVRLKGGDPYVLGRGGEERLACERAGVPVEVVPGVTSAVSVPAAVGIPVTHRGLASGFSVVTAHDELEQLPHRRDHTLVLLMGVARLAQSTQTLLSSGHDPDTPAAVIERGFSETQRTTLGTLSTIAERCAARGVSSPAVTVIGDVVTLAPH